MKIHINVTDSDIDHGVGCDSTACMVTRAIMRHVRPEVQVKTDYEYIELSLHAPLFTVSGGLDIYPGEAGSTYFVDDYDDHALVESRIRAFDDWKNAVDPDNIALCEEFKLRGAAMPERPEPFSFVIDVPARFLTAQAKAIAVVRRHGNVDKIMAEHAAYLDNSPSDLRVPKHTELLPT